MTTFTITMTADRKISDAAEWALCERYGIARSKHDNTSYDVGSDVDNGYMRISVKTSGFTLMAGGMCEGRQTIDDIWALYASRVHSNWFAYVAEDGTCYMMNLAEFERFVKTFCSLARESHKNGGAIKVRCRHESKKMRRWLDECTA